MPFPGWAESLSVLIRCLWLFFELVFNLTLFTLDSGVPPLCQECILAMLVKTEVPLQWPDHPYIKSEFSHPQEPHIYQLLSHKTMQYVHQHNYCMPHSVAVHTGQRRIQQIQHPLAGDESSLLDKENLSILFLAFCSVAICAHSLLAPDFHLTLESGSWG